MSDELLKRLETGHDKECAMSYGMHEHCCDCSYPARQEAAARVRELEEKLRIRQRASEIVGTMAMQQKERAERAEAELDNERARSRTLVNAATVATERAERAEAELLNKAIEARAMFEDAKREHDAMRAENERLQEEVAAMRAMLANPVGMVSAPSGTLPYKHLVRVREPLDAEIGCSLYAIRDSALRR